MKSPNATLESFLSLAGADLGGELRWVRSRELLDWDGWILASCPLWLHRVQVSPYVMLHLAITCHSKPYCLAGAMWFYL